MRRKFISRAFSAGTLLIMSASMASTLLMPLVAYAKGPPPPNFVSPSNNAIDQSVNLTLTLDDCTGCTSRQWWVADYTTGITEWSANVLNNGNSVVVNTTNGAFINDLLNHTALDNAGHYKWWAANTDGTGQGVNPTPWFFTTEAAPVPEMSTWIAIVTVVTGFGLMYKFRPAFGSKMA